MLTAGEFVYLIRADKSQLNKTLGESERDVKSTGERISSWTVAKGQMIGRFATKAIMKVNDITSAVVKNTIKAYGTFEQLQGGAELLFGSAYDKIMDKAMNAYQTVQMSANEYLDAVNGYAVGLKTSLGGDEKAAANLADKIIKAQADIVAATGRSRESVQNAFAGVMRGNYMMLDNLGLGIKGSKEGMEEVIKKVNEWNKTQNKMTKYQIGNLADMENALVDYVNMVGMADYAQEEASKTLEGTMASTKAAWKNLLVAFGSGKDVKVAIRNLTDSAKKLLKNMLPVAKNTIQSIGDFVTEIIPEIGKWVSELSTELKNSDNPIVKWIGNGIEEIQTLINGATNLILHFPETVEELKNSDDPFASLLGGALDTGYKALQWINEHKNEVAESIKVIGGAFLGWKISDTVMDAINTIKRFMYGNAAKNGTSAGNGGVAGLSRSFLNTGAGVALTGAAAKAGALFTQFDPTGLTALIPQVAGDYTVVGSTLKNGGSIGDVFKAYEKAIPKAAEKAAEKWAAVPNQIWSASGNMAGMTWNWLKGIFGGNKGGDWSTAGGDDWSAPVKVEPDVPKDAPKKITSEIGTVEVPVRLNIGGGFAAGGGTHGSDPLRQAFYDMFKPHAKGLWSVPYDNYPALLHRDEQVLTASQARHRNSGGDVDYGYISQMIGDSLERAMNRVNVLLDGGKVGDMTSRRTRKNIRRRDAAVLHGMGG